MFWDWLWFGIIVTLVLVVPVLSKAADSRRRLKVWQGIAERRNLSVVKVSTLPMRLGFTARSGPVEMRITGEKDHVRVVATVEGPPELAAVSIRRELILLPKGREIETGDPKFDDTFVVSQLSLAAEAGQLSLASHPAERVPLPPPQQRTR